MATEDGNSDFDLREEPEDWTPGRGLLRGLVKTMLVACAIAALQGVVTYYVPRLVLHGLLNGFGSFVITWILFATMHRAAGQVGGIITWTVVVLAAWSSPRSTSCWPNMEYSRVAETRLRGGSGCIRWQST